MTGMEFLVEFDTQVPEGTPAAEISRRRQEEAAAAERLSESGHLLRLWNITGGDKTSAIGLYRADDREEVDRLLGTLPLADWMRIVVTPLEAHPNDPSPLA